MAAFPARKRCSQTPIKAGVLVQSDFIHFPQPPVPQHCSSQTNYSLSSYILLNYLYFSLWSLSPIQSKQYVFIGALWVAFPMSARTLAQPYSCAIISSTVSNHFEAVWLKKGADRLSLIVNHSIPCGQFPNDKFYRIKKFNIYGRHDSVFGFTVHFWGFLFTVFKTWLCLEALRFSMSDKARFT